MSAHWKPLTEGIYFNVGQRTVCELVDTTPDLTYHDILDDIAYLTSTISIVHHRERSKYSDHEALLVAARVDRWIKKMREQELPQ
jgi:hypothetical protein